MISVKSSQLDNLIYVLQDVSNRTRLMEQFLFKLSSSMISQDNIKKILLVAGNIDESKAYLDFSVSVNTLTFTAIAKASAGTTQIDTRSSRIQTKSKLSSDYRSQAASTKSVSTSSLQTISNSDLDYLSEFAQGQLIDYLFINS